MGHPVLFTIQTRTVHIIGRTQPEQGNFVAYLCTLKFLQSCILVIELIDRAHEGKFLKPFENI